MRHRPGLVTPTRLPLVAAMLFAVSSADALAQPRAPVPPRVAARVAAGEAVDVIVGVAVPADAEGRLAPGPLAARRSAVARARTDVMAQASRVGVDVGTPFEALPYFRASVTRATLDRLTTVPGVTSVEEVVFYRPALAQSAALVHAPAAWAAGATGAGWTVAVLDTGIEKGHPFFGGRVVAEACYSAGSGLISLCPGGATSSTAPGSAAPCTASGCDHGTHVAGIVAGAGGGGASGVAPQANLIAVQVFSLAFGSAFCGPAQQTCLLSSSADIVSGLSRVLVLAGPANANRIAAVNLSLGGGAFTSTAACDAAHPSIKAAIDQLRSFGIATIAAAGNSGYGGAIAAPACISSAVSVGATTDTAPVTVPGYSNDASFLKLLAPGSDIASSVPGAGIAVKSGTSMAAPHVAGAWAALKHARPAATVDLVETALVSTGTPVVDPGTGRTHPLIDVDAAGVALGGGGPSLVPRAPTGFDATVSGHDVTLSWTPPASGAAPTGYAILVRSTPGGPIDAAVPVGLVTSLAAVAPDGAFVVSVVATNAAGVSAESNSLTLTVPGGLGRPDPPTYLVVDVTGTTASFRWTAPTGGGPVQHYVVVAGHAPGFSTPLGSIEVPASATTLTVPNVPQGTYYARVFARNASGPSAYSTNEVVVTVAAPLPPGTPTLHPPVVVGATVQVSWSPAPGSTATSFELQAASQPGGLTVARATLTGTSATFSSVTSGTYYLRLIARNAAGDSPPTAEVSLHVP